MLFQLFNFFAFADNAVMKWVSCLSFLLTGLLGVAQADPLSHAELRQKVQAFLQTQLQDKPGKITIQVGELDSRMRLAECPSLEIFLPAAAQLQGRTSVGVRCVQPSWSIFIPANVSILMNRYAAAKALPQGKVIATDDFVPQLGEMNQAGLITDENLLLGKVLKFALQSGQLFKQDMLRAPYVVMQGQAVQIVAEGNGVQIRAEGKALNNAASGQMVQVKVPSGHVLQGVATEGGVVEIRQ